MQWNISHKKEWNFAIYNNIDGPRGYCAEWSKSDGERQMPVDSLICGIQKNNWISRTGTDL